MSLKELEKQVQLLPRAEFRKFAEWFELYREATVLAEDEIGHEVTAAQREELVRRKAEYLSNPSIATAWDDGFFERLRQRLADVRAQKAASS